MARIEDIRSKYLVKEDEGDSWTAPRGIAGELDGRKWVVWSEAEVKGWSRNHTIVSLGADPEGNGYRIADVRFKSGRYADRDMTDMAQTDGRGYLRWWYTTLKESPNTHGMMLFIRMLLGETDEVIREKADTRG